MNTRKIIAIFCATMFILAIAYLVAAHERIYIHMHEADLRAPERSSYNPFIGSPCYDKLLTYVALGDSLTAGVGLDNNYEQAYPYLLAQKMSQGKMVRSLNLSQPGLRAADLFEKHLAMTVAANPDVVTVLIGTNDIHGGVSLAKFWGTYLSSVKTLKEKTHAQIYLINIPYLGTDSLILPPFNYWLDYQTQRYNKTIKHVASTNGATYIDLYTPTKNMPDSMYAADHFHPNAEGYKLWAEIIYDSISK